MKRNNTKRCHEKIIFNNNERYRKISISFNLVIFTAIFSFSLSPIILVSLFVIHYFFLLAHCYTFRRLKNYKRLITLYATVQGLITIRIV